MATEFDQQGRKFVAFYVGVIVDNADPEMLGRVRARVEGVVEKSAWAFPLGQTRAGSKGRGMLSAPPMGAEVGIFFAAGDVDHPYFVTGYYGTGEAPGPVGGYTGDGDPPGPASAQEATQIMAYEGDRYVLVVDERPGKCRIVARDKTTGDQVLLDGAKGGIEVKATTVLNIACAGIINMQGLQIVLNGRPVLPVGGPI